MNTERANLQRQITSSAYSIFAALLAGIAQADQPTGAEYCAMESLARLAIRQQMKMGWTDPDDYVSLQSKVREHLEMCFPQMHPIYLGYASDEVATLVLEELGLLSPTIH